MKLLLIILPIITGLAACGNICEAAVRFSPALVYEPFFRKTPERSGVIRLGGGFRMIGETMLNPVALEVEALYTNESTVFSSDNTLKEVMYRARGGVNVRFFEWRPLVFNARGGFQFNFIDDTYTLKVNGAREDTRARHSTAYTGLEVELVPFSGFGIITGATISGHEPLNKWLIQYYLGIVLR